MLSPRDRVILASVAAAAAAVLASVMNNNASASPDPGLDHATGNQVQAVPLKGVPQNDAARGLVYDGLKAAQEGPCVGSYQVTGIDFTMCTHGPDAVPAGLDVKRPIQPLAVGNGDLGTGNAGTGNAGTGNAGTQALAVCEGDGVSGRRVEVLYIHGSTSRYQQFLETFRTVAEGVDVIYNESARETGGERHVRFVTETVNGQCRPVIRDVQIPDAALNANDWAPLLNAVRAAGWTRTDRKYLEFVDANVFCGIGGFAGDTRKTDANRSNNGPEYARADNGCWTAGVAAHELGHNFGAVNNNAPNGSGLAHCTDEWDVMCYRDGPNTVIRTVCTNRSHDQRLDCNHDDYYHTNPSAGSYLSQFYNVADNLFLIRGGQGSPSPSPSVSPSTGAPFRLMNGASSTCFDVPNSNTTDGTQMIIWSCNNGANQSFTQTGQTLRVLGKCVTAFNNGTANGTRVVLSTCNNSAGQNWTQRPDGSISGVQSGRCLQPTGGATGNGTLIILQDCNGQPYQRWTRS